MAGHSSHKNLCSFCCVTKARINWVDLYKMNPRKAPILWRQASNWKSENNLDEHKKIFDTVMVKV
ncbi:hypothetical protein VP01_15054g1 [Puccinia sorghi]|uniref:Uncharacterized protein n=1 Tax=Puccinia sorghi TaxID=27349 RepID=A0A0L6VKU6_9BASI|nr:hypothetical protein VP01_15054g1 [Puccinia sorghi]